MKLFIKRISAFLILVLLIFGFALVLSFIYKDKITSRIVNEINKSVKYPISVNALGFSLVNHFPYATLELNDVCILSPEYFNKGSINQVNADTLLYVQKLHLSFHLIRLFTSELVLKQITFVKPICNVCIDKDGLTNYNIFNSVQIDSTSSENNFKIHIDQFQLKDASINYYNAYKNVELSIYSSHYKLKGDFYKKNFTIQTHGNIYLHRIRQEKILLESHTESILNLDMIYSKDTLIVKKGNFLNSGFDFGIKGRVLLNRTTHLNIEFYGNHIQISELMKYLPKNKLHGFKSDGMLNILGSVNGELNAKKAPHIKAKFSVKNASITKSNKKVFSSKLQLNGSYTNGKKNSSSTSEISIANFKLSMNDSFFSGSMSLKNFKKPYVTGHSKFHFDMKLLPIFSITGVNSSITGGLSGEYNFRGLIDLSKKFENMNLDNIKQYGNFQLVDGSYYNSELIVSKTEANIELKNKQLVVNQFSSNCNNAEISGFFTLDNLYQYVQKESKLLAKADIKINNFNYSDFEKLFETDSNTTQNFEIDIEALFSITNFKKDKLEIQQASGNLIYADKKMIINNYRINAFDGVIFGNMKYDNFGGEIERFSTHSKIDDVNIKKLFYAFNNFNQSTLKSEHINGDLFSDFELSANFINNEISSKTIDFLGHLKINGGTLTNFNPIMEVAKFSEITELENVKFSSLENDLLIYNQTVYIPEMTLSSNAFDINLRGEQNFDGDYSYHLKLYLSDFLSGKAKRIQKQQSEFGTINDDGFGRKPILLLVESKNGKSNVQIDKREIKKTLKSNLKQEKTELKTILQNEFGLFKKDSNKTEEKKEKPRFEIEWDDE